jgi:hypothetical protein
MYDCAAAARVEKELPISEAGCASETKLPHASFINAHVVSRQLADAATQVVTCAAECTASLLANLMHFVWVQTEGIQINPSSARCAGPHQCSHW